MTIARRLRAGVRGASLYAGLLALLSQTPACQNTDDLLKPGDVPVDVMNAVYIPDSVFVENPIMLNGEMLESEWGGPLDADLPFHQIRISGEEGEGDPGVPRYVSAKCIYTDSDIYFLYRWNDPQPDVFKDALVYIGPDYDPEDDCAGYLVNPANWAPSQGLDEDRLVVQFSIPDQQGANPGRRDVWQWLSTRTNPVRNLYNEDENPAFPSRGIPAYMEDAVFDPAFGLFFDSGTPPWRRNTRAPGEYLPTYVYRPSSDPFFDPINPEECFNAFGEDCLVNNGLPQYYVWREDLELQFDPFFACDSVNFVPVVQVEPRFWDTGDIVTGYWYTYPSGSRADVHAKAQWDLGVWTLEIGRPRETGDRANDISFSGPTGTEVPFTIQVYDNSGAVHWGSTEQRLRFAGPRAASGRPAPREGGL